MADEEENSWRKKRANGDRKRVREQKELLKQTVKMAKEAGHAIEYRGTLNRGTLVGY